MKNPRATYLQKTEWQLLENWCADLKEAFQDTFYGGVFLVGSCLEKRDFRDVDIRIILKHAEYKQLFGDLKDEENPKWRVLNLAISLWGQKVTGLPIDFQFQDISEANRFMDKKRNSMGNF